MSEKKKAITPVKVGDSFRVKPGCTAFLAGSLRREGYVHTFNVAQSTPPSWGERVTESAADRRARMAAEKEAKEEAVKSVAEDKQQISAVTFADAGPAEL